MNYKIVADMHTHTVHSHGSGSVEDNVLAAIEKGLSRIVISDHGPSHACYNIKDVDAYLKDIDRIREKYKNDIEVLAGVEMNLLSLNGDIDPLYEYEKLFDIKLMGYHKLARYKTFSDRARMLLFKPKTEAVITRNTQAYINAMDRNKIDVITHIGYGLPVDFVKIAQHAAKKGVILEINAKHPEFSAEELKACAETGVLFSIGSDAHSPERIGYFEPALQKARAANIPAKQIINARS